MQSGTCKDCQEPFTRDGRSRVLRCMGCQRKRDKTIVQPAGVLARKAIRDGILIKRPCEVCGAAQVDAHHDDYSRPLDVRWLCRSHHLRHHFAEVHRTLGASA